MFTVKPKKLAYVLKRQFTKQKLCHYLLNFSMFRNFLTFLRMWKANLNVKKNFNKWQRKSPLVSIVRLKAAMKVNGEWSCHSAKNHLLFYIRKKCIRLWKNMRMSQLTFYFLSELFVLNCILTAFALPRSRILYHSISRTEIIMKTVFLHKCHNFGQ